LDDATQGLDGATQSLDGATQGLDGATQGLDGATQGLDGATQGLDGATQGLDGAIQTFVGANERFVGDTQSFVGANKTWMKTSKAWMKTPKAWMKTSKAWMKTSKAWMKIAKAWMKTAKAWMKIAKAWMKSFPAFNYFSYLCSTQILKSTRMKKTLLYLLLPVFLAVSLHLSGDSVLPGSEYRPVFMTRDELNRSVFYVAEGRALNDPAKIYSLAPYIYVSERYKGIHIINNSNPRSPVNEAFIVAPGCLDMAIKDGILYIDNAVDLVAFDLTAKTVVQRLTHVLPEPSAPGLYAYLPDRPEGMILVGWKKWNE
jgi:hypothetical protein